LQDPTNLKPIVLLADRTVSSEKLKRLTDSLCGEGRKVPALVVRLQREKIDRQSESTGTVEIKAPSKADFIALENVLRDITRNSDLKLSDNFKPGDSGYFSFRPLIGFLEFGGQISDGKSGKIYWDFYQSVVQDWVEVVLRDLYEMAKVERARRPALRAMMCAALTQLCELDCKGFSVDLFRPILEDGDSQHWLFEDCQQIEGKDLLPIEYTLLKEAYHTLDSVIRGEPNDEEYVERSGIITPFREIIDACKSIYARHCG